MRCSIKAWCSSHLAICAAAIALIAAPALLARTAPADIALKAAAWLDVESGRMRGPSVFLITAGKISAIVEPARFSPADAAETIDLGTAVVLPGLIDAHVHLQIGGAPAANAAAVLDAGFTTVIDLGATSDEIIRLRDAIAAGKTRGPRILAAGLWAGTSGGVCEFGGIGIADGPDGFRRRVTENVQAGADLIKVCVSSWPAGALAAPDVYEIADASLAALVSESHARQKRVVAHAISSGAVRIAIASGVDGLAHAAFLTPDSIRVMRDRGIFMIPTLASLLPGTPAEGRAALAGSVRAAHEGGVRLVFGTDGGVLPHGRNAREFAALLDAGIPPAAAIRAATAGAAAAFNLQDTGVLRTGAIADIIAVSGNPLDDATALSRVRFVMRAGRVVKPLQ